MLESRSKPQKTQSPMKASVKYFHLAVGP